MSFENFLYVTIIRVIKTIRAVALKITWCVLTLANEATLVNAKMTKIFRMITMSTVSWF